ncbi:MAG: hypothetical protein O2904_02725 [bacterium]|nr:hypothetical protein [bacterium]
MKHSFPVITAFAFILFPFDALAASLGATACSVGSVACDGTLGSGMISSLLESLGKIFLAGAAGFAILFVVYGGFMMLMSFGDESKVTKGRNAVIFSLGGFALTLVSQTIVSFVVTKYGSLAGAAPSSGGPLIDVMEISVGIMLGAFNAVFALIAVVAGIRFVISHGKTDEAQKAKTMIIWAVIGALVINTAHVLVRGIFNAPI